jgi:hypothetical protein
LSQAHNLIRIIHFEGFNIFNSADQPHGRFAHRAFDFFVAGMSYEHERMAFAREADCFEMNFGNERAGRVYHAQAFALRKVYDLRRHAVRAKDAHSAVGHIFELFDEDHVALAEIIDHVTVMDDLVKDVNRRREIIESAFNYVNGSHNARAKTARLSEHYFSNRHGDNPS